MVITCKGTQTDNFFGIFGSLNVYENEDNTVLFSFNEVSEKLGYAKPRNAFLSHIAADFDEDEGVYYTLPRTEAGEAENILWTNPADKKPKILISQAGVVALSLKSKLDSARKFRRWVCMEVIPSIQNNGAYVKDQEKLPESEKADVVEKEQALADQVQDDLQIENARLKGIISKQEADIEFLKRRRHVIIVERDKAKAKNKSLSKELDARKEDGRYQQAYIDYLIDENGRQHLLIFPPEKRNVKDEVTNTTVDKNGFVININNVDYSHKASSIATA